MAAIDPAVWAPLGTAALTLVGAGVAKLWQALVQQPRLDLMERCAQLVIEKQETEKALAAKETELKTEQKEHWTTAIELARLSAKYELVRGRSSRPPPT